MRLLNLNTLELREFIDSARPPYVILSHTWEAEEVSLQEFYGPNVQNMAGYSKILNFCCQGKENGFEWGWVDTCCIDKTNSAELSEAINSMYRWYQEAVACYVFLSDVFRQQSHSIEVQFAQSRWFTRRWTLQELLAPENVVFYSRDWTVYGTKTSLQDAISHITDIPMNAITLPKYLITYSFAQKMSWASNRQTTRPEDLAYSLLGILGVHMPLLYGEGKRAFKRLQEEFIKLGNDQTIFAWPSSAIEPGKSDSLSLLAPSPAAFKDAGNIRRWQNGSDSGYGPWSVTNRGIRIEDLPMIKTSSAKKLLSSLGFETPATGVLAVALIYCSKFSTTQLHGYFGIALYKNRDIYYRFRYPESLLLLNGQFQESTRENCIIRFQSGVEVGGLQDVTQPLWIIKEVPEKLHSFKMVQTCVQDPRISASSTAFHLEGADAWTSTRAKPVGLLFSHGATEECFIVVIGHQQHGPWVDIVTGPRDGDLIPIVHSYEYNLHNIYFDHISMPLNGGMEVSVSIVCGVQNGERAFFLDASIREQALQRSSLS